MPWYITQYTMLIYHGNWNLNQVVVGLVLLPKLWYLKFLCIKTMQSKDCLYSKTMRSHNSEQISGTEPVVHNNNVFDTAPIIGCLSFPISLLPSFASIYWGYLPDKLLALKTWSQHLLQGEHNIGKLPIKECHLSGNMLSIWHALFLFIFKTTSGGIYCFFSPCLTDKKLRPQEVTGPRSHSKLVGKLGFQTRQSDSKTASLATTQSLKF